MKKTNGEKSRHIFFLKPRQREAGYFLTVLVNTVRLFILSACVFGFAVIGMVVGVVGVYHQTTPDLNVGKLEDVKLTSFIYDCNGELITDYRGTENRIWVEIEQIPLSLQNAFIATEDERFRSHNGIDVKRILGALIGNLANDTQQGGSTITQQLVKQRLLSSESSYKRKLQEAFIALELEKMYSKEQILEWYLNIVPMGNGNYGVEAASQDYFGKSVQDLSLRECACLAAITRSPTKYNPRRCYYNEKSSPSVIEDRCDYVLLKMMENKLINENTYAQTKLDRLQVVELSSVNKLYDMPSAVEAVLEDAIKQLMVIHNLTDNSTNRKLMRTELQTGGYSIYSTIDPKLQKIAENVIYSYDKWPKLASASDEVIRYINSDGTTTDVIQPQTGFVLVDSASRQVRAIVGGRQAPKAYLEYNRAIASTMPVGSSIKPLAIYGPALNKGIGLGSVTCNLPLPIEGWGTRKGYPANSSSNKSPFVSIRTGITASLNIVAARTLLEEVGTANSKEYLIQMGVQPDHVMADGSGLALGTSGITPFEMAQAYTTIANGGIYQPSITFTKILDGKGQTVVDQVQNQLDKQKTVFDQGTAWMLVDALTNAVRSGTGTNARIPSITVAGKTGTNSDNKGAFFAGMTPDYTAAIWVGHDGYKALTSSSTGGKAAAPLWQAILSEIYKTTGQTDHPILPYDANQAGLVKATVCGVTGLLAEEECQHDFAGIKVITDYFHPEDVPKDKCTRHTKAQFCKTSGMLAGPYCPIEETEERVVLFPLEKEETLLNVKAELINPHLYSLYFDKEKKPDSTKYEELAKETCSVHLQPTPTPFWPILTPSPTKTPLT